MSDGGSIIAIKTAKDVKVAFARNPNATAKAEFKVTLKRVSLANVDEWDTFLNGVDMRPVKRVASLLDIPVVGVPDMEILGKVRAAVDALPPPPPPVNEPPPPPAGGADEAKGGEGDDEPTLEDYLVMSEMVYRQMEEVNANLLGREIRGPELPEKPDLRDKDLATVKTAVNGMVDYLETMQKALDAPPARHVRRVRPVESRARPYVKRESDHRGRGLHPPTTGGR